MSWPTILTMVLILGVIWGGFSLCLVTALRRERSKNTPHDS